MFGLIAGNVFRDVEVKESKAGKPYIRATVKDGSGDDAIFVTVYAFDSSEAFEVLRKAGQGDALSAQGRVKFRTYEKDGVSKVGVDLMADNILPVGGIKKPERTTEPAARRAGRTTGEMIDDGIPEW